MTTEVDIVNRALQKIGTRTTVASLSENSNEAIQANMILGPNRDELLRMAPWNCASNYANMVFITSAPGTPENPAADSGQWHKGVPPPGWSYEYQYPVDCMRPLWVVPQFTTGFAGGVPITSAVTGGTSSTSRGPPIKFRIGIDQFIPVTIATVAAGGAGYLVGETVTLAGTPVGAAPIGAPAQLRVLTIGGGGAISSVQVVNQVAGSAIAQGGSYFARQANPVGQASSDGSGFGAFFNLSYGARSDQRVLWTQQQSAILCYLRQVVDPNVMDPLFIDAWTSIVGARLVMALTGDKSLANLAVQSANASIAEARKADGNEGLTIQDHTPDWIRTRGIYFLNAEWTPNMGFEWGSMFSNY